MNRPLKIALITIAVLLAIVIVPVAALVLLVDPNSFKPQIVAAVKQQTGREFRIDGELGWSFYPVLGIELGHTELGNAPGFGDKPMLAVERVAVGVELLPLLDRELNIAQLRLEQPQINLAVDKNGRSNWDDIVERQQKDTAPASGTPAPADTAASASQPRIAVSGLHIVDGALGWHDAKNAQTVQVTALMLETGAINASTPVDVALSMHVSSNSPALEADISFATAVLFDTAKRTLSLQDAVLKTAVTGKDIPAGKQTLALDLKTVAVDLDKQTLAIPALVASIAGVQVKASVDGHDIVDKPQFAGQLSVADVSLRKLLDDAGIALPVMADANTLKKFAFAASYTATPQRVDMSKIKLNLDDSVISGGLNARLGDITQVGFDLALDAINADRYMAPPSPEVAAPVTQGAVAAPVAANDSETFAALDTLAVNGKFGIGKLHVQNLDLTDVTIKLKTEGRTVAIDPFAASLYSGKTVSRINIDGRGARAQSHAAVLLLGLNVGNFLDAFLQKRGPIEGNGNIAVDVNFTGLDGDSILSSASGKGELRFLDGAVRGINIAQEIRNALALLRKQPRQDAVEKTDFTEMVVPFTIDKGVLSWHDMTANSPLLRIGSKGDFNLLTQQVDTRVDASVVSTLKGQGGEALSEIAGFLVPVKVRGAMSDPKISIDIKKVLQQTVLGEKQQALEAKVDERKEELKLKADEKKDEAKKKAGEELKRGLDKLFKKKE